MSTRPIVPMAKQLKPDDYMYSVDAPPLPPANPKGMISPGNINVFDRPIVPNPDGGSSTVYSASFGTDKGETLVPRVSDGADKRPPHIMSNPEALNYFKKTGQSLGTFDNPDDADAYANGLHEQQAKLGSFNGRTTLPQLIHKTPLEQPELVSASMGGVPNLGNAPSPQIAKMPTAGEQQIQSDQGQLQKVRWAQANPWGTANNHPGKVGKIAHVLSTAANIAGDILAPGITANVSGSQLNMQEREGSLAKRLNTEISDEAVNQEHGAQQAHLEQENANAPIEAADKHAQSEATTGHLNAETQAAQTPSLATAYAHAVQEAIKKGQDPSTDPIVMHLSDAIVGLQPGQNKTPTLHYETTVGPDGKPHVYGLDEKGAKVADEGEHYEKPMSVNVNAGEAALDREVKQFGSGHQKSLELSNAQLEKIADARAMINGNAEAQGLGIPKVLTALVGGQGTGVRITQAELQAIAHARGIQGDFEGTLNKLSGKGALSHQQQQQLTQIMDDVKARIQQKQAIAGEALDKINGASSRQQIIQADKEARQKLTGLDGGGDAKEGDTKVNGAGIKVKFSGGKWGPA